VCVRSTSRENVNYLYYIDWLIQSDVGEKLQVTAAILMIAKL